MSYLTIFWVFIYNLGKEMCMPEEICAEEKSANDQW